MSGAMALVLVLSSFVAASRVGAKPVEHALTAHKIDAVVVPTTLFGRHPGWGPPGGGATPLDLFSGMIDGVRDQGLFSAMDAVITGYFASPEQVRVAAATIAEVRAARPGVLIAVDPVMGDSGGGLYVPAAVADAIATVLAPLADLIAPNLWELGFLAGRPVRDLTEIAAAARGLAPRALVSSVRDAERLGAAYIDAEDVWLAAAPAEAQAPNGTGDLLIGAFVAATLSGLPAPQALHRSVGVTADIVRRAARWGARELPLAAAPDAFIAPSVFASLRKG